MLNRYEYYKEIFKNIPKPFAFVDLDLLDENIEELRKRSGDKKIRVASKSIRCRTIIERVLKANNQFEGLMCYTATEALWLNELGYNNLLIGYPTTDLNQIEQIAIEVSKGKNICLMIDSEEQAKRIDEIGKNHNVKIPVCLDIDMSSDFPGIHFGVWRSNLRTSNNVETLGKKLLKYTNLSVIGIMGYEAQIAGLVDNLAGNGLKNIVVRKLKSKSIQELRKRREESIQKLKQLGYNLNLVNGGGTGSLESTREETDVTEVTIGSGFFNSHLFDNYQNFKHQPAAGFAVEVVRKPKDGMVTCLGGGYIASGGTGNEKQPLPYLPEGLKLTQNEGAGEVQTPLQLTNGTDLKLGDPVFFRHSKAGELCERFNELYLVSKGQIIDCVKTYRGEGKCFL
ncbi:amino acid deaminase/aldolase [Solitalea sp. MAHUQ-68]|uniref:Amino acid deaminase/aldolase n=1 Tax=Solitalea agri TaxID=2953739 RepID=A0A9X2JGN6_9SPHI|nr:amino acid deaminase/aldolase [Solitalea agri]MCO4294611.1 amino acid deaminase/aldolase [Solitalea agri]